MPKLMPRLIGEAPEAAAAIMYEGARGDGPGRIGRPLALGERGLPFALLPLVLPMLLWRAVEAESVAIGRGRAEVVALIFQSVRLV